MTTLRKSYPTIAQSFLIAGIIIFGTLIFIPINMLLHDATGKEVATLIYYLCSMGLSLFVVHIIRKKKFKSDSFNLHLPNPKLLPLIILAIVALVFGIILPISDLLPVPENLKESLIEAASQKGLPTFITMVLAAPILEELFFRGIMLDGLLKNYKPFTSIFITSLLFGLVHLNPWQFIAGFILGIFIGLTYYKTSSLLYAILIHATANLCGYILRIFSSRDSLDDSAIEMYGGFANLILIIFGSILVTLSCVYLVRKAFKENLNLEHNSGGNNL